MVLLVAPLWLIGFPTPAFGGYDIAHIVKRTCEPGGPLVVMDEWKARQDRDRIITEPGKVIGCPPAGTADAFQIAAGPARNGGEDSFMCAYFSLHNGDGSDTCLAPDSIVGSRPEVHPLMSVRPNRSAEFWLAGIATGGVVEVEVPTGDGASHARWMVHVDGE